MATLTKTLYSRRKIIHYYIITVPRYSYSTKYEVLDDGYDGDIFMSTNVCTSKFELKMVLDFLQDVAAVLP